MGEGGQGWGRKGFLVVINVSFNNCNSTCPIHFVLVNPRINKWASAFRSTDRLMSRHYVMCPFEHEVVWNEFAAAAIFLSHSSKFLSVCVACSFSVLQSGTCQSLFCIYQYLSRPYSSNATVCVYKCFTFPCLFISTPVNCHQRTIILSTRSSTLMSQHCAQHAHLCYKFFSAHCYPHTECVKLLQNKKPWITLNEEIPPKNPCEI